jgi:hypothetical protein
MSRSVQRDCSLSVSECPPVPAYVLTRETSDREVGIAPLQLSRDYTPVSPVSSLVDTLMLLPKGAIYFRTRKHDSVVKVLERLSHGRLAFH